MLLDLSGDLSSYVSHIFLSSFEAMVSNSFKFRAVATVMTGMVSIILFSEIFLVADICGFCDLCNVTSTWCQLEFSDETVPYLLSWNNSSLSSWPKRALRKKLKSQNRKRKARIKKFWKLVPEKNLISTHIWPVFPFYTRLITLENLFFLCFQGVKNGNWPEMNYGN